MGLHRLSYRCCHHGELAASGTLPLCVLLPRLRMLAWLYKTSIQELDSHDPPFCWRCLDDHGRVLGI